jgi:four helix bundle protein
MQDQTHIPIEQMDFFKRYVAVSNWVWHVVETWKPLTQDTIGKQLIRACDSIGANLVEGDGRYTHADALHFLVIARASAREMRYWLERASDRCLLEPEIAGRQIEEITSATRMLNQLINYRRNRSSSTRIKEPIAYYSTGVDEDPFVEPDFKPLIPNTQYPTP